MKTIIHDLNDKELRKIVFNSNDYIINSKKCNNNCIGCFSCWIKHPKVCTIKDEYSNIVESLSKSDKFIIISKCRYGCFDNNVKRVLERCIGYVLPFFTIRNGKIHHKSRYNKKLDLCVYLYGDIDSEDLKCVTNLIKANAININCNLKEIKLFDNKKELIRFIH